MEDVNNIGVQVYFGGRNANGALSDAWLLHRDPNYTGATYTYRWENANPPSLPSGLTRSDHSAARIFRDGPEGGMVVFGGLDNSNATLNNTFEMYFSSSRYRWRKLEGLGTIPSVRYGHTAIYDETRKNGNPSDTLFRRMIVFGGAAASGATPTDLKVYEMRLLSPPDTVMWIAMTETDLGGPKPGPRFGQAMAMDPRDRTISGKIGHAALMFGGKLSTHSDSLWALYLFNDNTYGWKLMSAGGYPPSARSKATLMLSMEQGTGSSASRIYIWGGEDGSGPVNGYQYVLDPWAASPYWTQWAQSDFTPVGHAGAIDARSSFARTAEVYNPASNTWQLHSSANLLQETYPPAFVVSGGSTASGRVISIGKDKFAYALDVSADGTTGSWSKLSNAQLDFHAEAAVMYRPGNIMVGGGISSTWPNASNITKKLDTASLSNSWQGAAPTSGSGSLVTRNFHNLVLLPDGKVLAVGGMHTAAQDVLTEPVLRPQIWDPDANSGVGAWSDTTLARQATQRDYHSTAILLPDARVLSAGGQYSTHSVLSNIYCPPYLFNGDSVATRPVLHGTTGRWRYGAMVDFAVNDDMSITGACLIRAPATTHALDQSQRYVPITLGDYEDDGNGLRTYFATAPADSFIAPPGDYMLFVLNASGVPAIAQWVRVGSVYSDQFDATAPDTMMAIEPEFVTSSALYPMWTAPGDDHVSGVSLEYDVRYSTSQITDANFSSRTLFSNIPIPKLTGWLETGASATGLSSCTWYYVAGKTRDGAEHWSAIGGRTKIKTLCSGGGGASMGRERVVHALAGSRATGETRSIAGYRPIAKPADLTQQGSSVRLVGTFSRGSSMIWNLRYENLGSESELLEASTTHLVVQEPISGGGWRTRSSASMPPGPVGARALRISGRVIFPAGAWLEAIELEPTSYTCETADHSRLGDLLATSESSIATEFGSNDELELSYAPSQHEGAGEDCFFRVLIPTPAQESRFEAGPRQRIGIDVPAAFALHAARPNPFSDGTTIRFDLPRASEVRMEIFDLQGRRLTTLASGSREAGRHSIHWSGSTEGRTRARAGVYLCRLTAGDFVAERRISLLP